MNQSPHPEASLIQWAHAPSLTQLRSLNNGLPSFPHQASSPSSHHITSHKQTSTPLHSTSQAIKTSSQRPQRAQPPQEMTSSSSSQNCELQTPALSVQKQATNCSARWWTGEWGFTKTGRWRCAAMLCVCDDVPSTYYTYQTAP